VKELLYLKGKNKESLALSPLRSLGTGRNEIKASESTSGGWAEVKKKHANENERNSLAFIKNMVT